MDKYLSIYLFIEFVFVFGISVALTLAWFLETGDMTIRRSQALIHGKQRNWTQCKQYPQSIDEVDLYPESNDNKQD